MSGKNISFDNKRIKKINFYKNKKPFEVNNTDPDNILISKERTLW